MSVRIPAVLYARFSPRANSKNCPSCDVQLDDLRRHCEARGYTIVGEFRDDAKSGKSEKKRQGLRNAIAACRRGFVFLCRDQKRLARSLFDSFSLVRKLARRGVIFETLHDGSYDANDPNKLGMFGVKAVFAEMERLRISIDTRDKMRRHQANGRRMSNVPPYGYARDPADPKKLVPHAVEQMAISRIIELHGENRSLLEIGRLLELEGTLNRGRSWNHKLLGRILRREAAKEAV